MKSKILVIILAGMIGFSHQSISVKASNAESIQGEELIETVEEELDVINKMETVDPIIETNDMTYATSDFEVSNGVLVRYNGTAENVVIPGDLGITSIGDEAFLNNSKIKNVTIPEGVVEIGFSAFSGCKSLIQIQIPNSVKMIYGYAFSSCENIIEMKLPDTLEGLGFDAFFNCKKLKKINIPTGLSAIIYDTFVGCESLESITIPDNIESIGMYAFADCTSLKSITFSKNVAIGAGTFQGCTSLENITIPEGNGGIAANVFRGCTKLTEVTISSTVEFISNNAFYGCSNLKKVKFMGNAPSIYIDDIYNHNDLSTDFFAFCPEGLKVYYLSGKTGFGSTGMWWGRKTEVIYENEEKINNFVTRLYEKVLGRKADTSGLEYHTNTLKSKETPLSSIFFQ